MSTTPSEQIQKAFELFDAANAQDPNKEVYNGETYPKELLYAQRMTEILGDFLPDASTALQLACRSQHICRWEIARDSYPMDRIGYLQWRSQLKIMHAEKASSILKEVGFDEATCHRTRGILTTKEKKLKRDDETQCIEDVICLVFLKYYYDDFLVKHDEAKIIDILKKPGKKMSEKGHEAA